MNPYYRFCVNPVGKVGRVFTLHPVRNNFSNGVKDYTLSKADKFIVHNSSSKSKKPFLSDGFLKNPSYIRSLYVYGLNPFGQYCRA